jgi:hypothetical protein
MSNVDYEVERLIVRRLDGANSEEDELRLDRELIRNPEARALMEEYQQTDRLAAAALQHAFAEPACAFDPATLPAQPERPQRPTMWRSWPLWSGAAAAAVLALVVARVPLGSEPAPTGTPIQRGVPLVDGHDTSRLPGVGDGRPWSVSNPSSGVPRIRRDTGREVFGVIGDDGNVYWIEVDRSRTVRRPNAGTESTRSPL